METEIWKAHPEYVGIEVSTLGRVRTLDKMVWNGRGTWFMKGRILNPARYTGLSLPRFLDYEQGDSVNYTGYEDTISKLELLKFTSKEGK